MKVQFEEGESFLKKVHLIEIPCSLEMKMKGVTKETLKFRFLTPQMSKGHWGFERDIGAFILQTLDKAEGEERKRCAHLLRIDAISQTLSTPRTNEGPKEISY